MAAEEQAEQAAAETTETAEPPVAERPAAPKPVAAPIAGTKPGARVRPRSARV